jgi:hypothetical protein
MIAANAMDETIPNDSVRLSLQTIVEELIKAREKFKLPGS